MSAIQGNLDRLHQAWLAFYAGFGGGAEFAARVKVEEFSRVIESQMQYAESLIEEEIEYVSGLGGACN